MNYVLTALGMLLCLHANGRQTPQQSAPDMLHLPDKAFRQINSELDATGVRIQKQTKRYIHRLQKLETAMYNKLVLKDSLLAKQLFLNADTGYVQLLQPLPPADVFRSVYNSGVDSIATALHFVQSKLPAVDSRITQSLGQVAQVQQQLNISEQASTFLQQRQQQLQQLGMLKQWQQFNKQCYYYKAQMQQYRQMLSNPQLMQNALLSSVKQLPAFQRFFAQHSQLAALFAIPGSAEVSDATVPVGLQTREMVTSSLTSRYGSMQVANAAMQQNMPSPQSHLQQVQNKLTGYKEGGYGSGNADMSSFQPNNQKTKSLWQRITLGMNIQTQRASYYFPVTTDVAVSVGYKLSDKWIVGTGISGKIGWGTGWSHIQLSAQGLGLRSFMEAQLKGSFWATGGYELNYRPSLDSLANLHASPISSWQKSGLVGICKIISLRSKTFKRTKVQVLWDFLSYSQVPRTPALLWRIEYSFK
ncbi:hypothetical protein SAMN05421788_101544 [Filimonas lacunae]|uniref:Uncharacterized protein n=1 Tax=Filimonas lacunae TaxID=477680 RepID=A0A173MNP1_9BACT|nr:hypothetical protein [Filimonas lacunae]BAV09097.1 hypothetical protein FLA_5145 [Filimonas lacunae]SIS67259.1 hypothetical protein SAMN05421788_101544 [Filimonas lacunae]